MAEFKQPGGRLSLTLKREETIYLTQDGLVIEITIGEHRRGGTTLIIKAPKAVRIGREKHEAPSLPE